MSLIRHSPMGARALATTCAALALLAAPAAQATTLPENDFDEEDDLTRIVSLTEDEFNDMLDWVQFVFRPIVAFHDGNLTIERYWNDSTVNAYALRRHPDHWVIQMFGGLARRPEVTQDAFVLVACHELGHHLAGYPFKANATWAAAEGTADYYAAHVCARALWLGDEATNATYRGDAPHEVAEDCDASFDDRNEQNLCRRIALAGRSLSALLAHGRPAPEFDTPDHAKITQTLSGHPAPQCRLDTYFAGACCSIAPNLDVIPGLHAFAGRNSVSAEMEAGAYSCFVSSQAQETPEYNGHPRPRCWFKPWVVQ